ncbi:MAG: DUF2254 domain-containing protein [Ginsengibacter sp.]
MGGKINKLLNTLSIWIGKRYLKVINSIAFYPALIAFSFLIFSFFFVSFDFSDMGKSIKSQLHWLSLKDPSTARSIISAIVSGIISLAVFSFSMVMIILNQTASQMSNRILDKLIGNRFQQVVLGFYIGTIVFALYLLSTIRDINSGIYIPALSTYFLILLTIVDIFLFIYFLHFVTQSVKYEVIIQRIFKETKSAMERYCPLQKEQVAEIPDSFKEIVNANTTAVYEGFNRKALTELCNNNDCIVQILVTQGTFVFKDTPIIKLSKNLPDDEVNDLVKTIYLNDNESIDNNFFYGFRQLTEVAVKALSPGINDPGTAIECLRALSKLFLFRIKNFPDGVIRNKQNKIIIIKAELSSNDMFKTCIFPIWDYGKNDRMIQQELFQILNHLRSISEMGAVNKLFYEVSLAIENNNV